jgi:hypothetical protein
MSIIRKTVFALVVLVTFSIVPKVSAHRPDVGNDTGVTTIPDPLTSYAYYRQFDGSEPIHVYAFHGKAGQFFHAGINIPKITGLKSYQVEMALLGPGLPSLEQGKPPESRSESEHLDHDHDHPSVSIPLPADLNLDGLGGVIVESQAGEDFFEPFTQTNYWGRQSIDLTLPESGKYTLLVWNSAGENGKYVLDTGTKEVFGTADILRFPIWWLNTRLYFEQGPQLIGFASLLAFGLIGMVVYRIRKR